MTRAVSLMAALAGALTLANAGNILFTSDWSAAAFDPLTYISMGHVFSSGALSGKFSYVSQFSFIQGTFSSLVANAEALFSPWIDASDNSVHLSFTLTITNPSSEYPFKDDFGKHCRNEIQGNDNKLICQLELYPDFTQWIDLDVNLVDSQWKLTLSYNTIDKHSAIDTIALLASDRMEHLYKQGQFRGLSNSQESKCNCIRKSSVQLRMADALSYLGFGDIGKPVSSQLQPCYNKDNLDSKISWNSITITRGNMDYKPPEKKVD